MTERPVFPPLLRPFAVTPDLDPFERCIKLAAEGAEPGTLLWSIGQDACECAVVLAPEQSLEPSLPIVLVAMLGLGDGLGTLVPPMVAVTFGWPDRIEVNGGVVGGVRFATAATEAPERHSGLAGDRLRHRDARALGRWRSARAGRTAPRSPRKAAATS